MKHYTLLLLVNLVLGTFVNAQSTKNARLPRSLKKHIRTHFRLREMVQWKDYQKGDMLAEWKNSKMPKSEFPYLLKADFNGDQQEDYAILFIAKHGVTLVAFLRRNNAYIHHILSNSLSFKRVLEPDYLVEYKPGKLSDANSQPVYSKYPGIVLENWVYYWEDGKFKVGWIRD